VNLLGRAGDFQAVNHDNGHGPGGPPRRMKMLGDWRGPREAVAILAL
jgi:hypothetical protein